MSNPNAISNFELMVLLALIRLGDEAYGVPISLEIEKHSGHDTALGSVYAALERLQGRGFVSSTVGEPTPERGGRAKKFYRVTAQGKKALQETHRAVQRLSIGLEGRLTTCLSL